MVKILKSVYNFNIGVVLMPSHKIHLAIAKKNKVNVIRTSYDSYHIAKLIGLCNYIKTMIRTYHPVVFEESAHTEA